MKEDQRPIYVLFVMLFILVSCNSKRNSNNPNIIDKSVANKDTTIQTELPTEFISQLIVGKIYRIENNGVIIRKGPGENFEKLINEKVTQNSKKIYYAQVDKSVTVKINEIKGSWANIQVIEPDWLTETHVGWIPAEYILGENKTDVKLFEQLTKRFFTTLIDSINNNQFTSDVLRDVNLKEEYNGIYWSYERIGKKPKHSIDILIATRMVIFHTSDIDFWMKIFNELKSIKKQSQFNELNYIGLRYVDGRYTFELLKPINDINPEQSIYYDLYVYPTKTK